MNADIFLISQSVLDTNEKVQDAMILHELCHWLIDSGSIEKAKFNIDEEAEFHGKELYSKTDYEIEYITKHTILFCTVLAAASQRMHEVDFRYRDRWDAISAAMIYDLRSNISH